MNIGEQIKKAREEAGIFQSELALSVGVSENYISLIENGHKNPSDKLLKKIAKICEREVEITRRFL